MNFSNRQIIKIKSERRLKIYLIKRFLKSFLVLHVSHTDDGIRLTSSRYSLDVFDIYINKDNTKVFLIDFNPYAPQTDSLLFSWEELQDISLAFDPSSSIPTVRIINSTIEASQSMPSFSHNRYPADVIDLSAGASIAEFAKEWQTVLEKGVKETLHSSDDESE